MKPINTPFAVFQFVPLGSLLWVFHGDIMTSPDCLKSDVSESRLSIRLYLN